MAYPKGKPHSTEAIAKMRAAHARRLQDPKARKLMEACLVLGQGRPLSDERRAAISKRMREREFSSETIEKLRRAATGKKQREETRAKRSASLQAFYDAHPERCVDPLTPEQRDRQRSAVRGRKQSSEERASRRKSLQESWDRRGNKHAPETLEKMRAKRALQTIPLKATKIEIKVREILAAFGVAFRTNAAVAGCGRHQWDVVVDEKRLLVEVDGCFWHGCERCIPEERRTLGARNKANDEALNVRAFAAGWRLIRIWEHDMGSQQVFDQVTVALMDDLTQTAV